MLENIVGFLEHYFDFDPSFRELFNWCENEGLD